MIKFFRNIRKKLLYEGKISRYLTYAIGEIVLVVIGILIALQINNWNDHQKEKLRTQELLGNLRQELTEDYSYFKNVYEVETQLFLPSAERLFRVHGALDETLPSDSLMGTSFRFVTFTPIIKYTDNVFTELMGSNLLKDPKYEVLKTKLFEYYAQIEFLKSYSEKNSDFETLLMRSLSNYYTITPAEHLDQREISNFSGAAEASFTASYDLMAFRADKSLNAQLYDMMDIHIDRIGGLEIIIRLSEEIRQNLEDLL